MNTQEVYQYIKNLFNELEHRYSIEELDSLMDSMGIRKQVEDFYIKYPSFDFFLTISDIQSLKSLGVINENNKLDATKFPSDPLSKLLASVLWKNGDINKVQHIIDGVMGSLEDRSEYSLIFKQYGASLASEDEPIVDQHVLRAFELYSLNVYSESSVEKSQKKSLFKTIDRPLLDRYRTWFKKIMSSVPVSERKFYKDKLDKIIFISGKAVKC
jgi:hypothetical protein